MFLAEINLIYYVTNSKIHYYNKLNLLDDEDTSNIRYLL